MRLQKTKPLSPDELVDTWLQTSSGWVQTFIDQIGEDRVISFNNRLKPHSQPEAYKRQLSKLIKVRKRTSSFGVVGVFVSLRFLSDLSIFTVTVCIPDDDPIYSGNLRAMQIVVVLT